MSDSGFCAIGRWECGKNECAIERCLLSCAAHLQNTTPTYHTPGIAARKHTVGRVGDGMRGYGTECSRPKSNDSAMREYACGQCIALGRCSSLTVRHAAALRAKTEWTASTCVWCGDCGAETPQTKVAQSSGMPASSLYLYGHTDLLPTVALCPMPGRGCERLLASRVCEPPPSVSSCSPRTPTHYINPSLHSPREEPSPQSNPTFP